MLDIGFITSGDGAQLTCYEDFAEYLDERIYLRDYVNGVDVYRELLLEFAFYGNKTSQPPAGN